MGWDDPPFSLSRLSLVRLLWRVSLGMMGARQWRTKAYSKIDRIASLLCCWSFEARFGLASATAREAHHVSLG